MDTVWFQPMLTMLSFYDRQCKLETAWETCAKVGNSGDACIFRREAADGRPVEIIAAIGK
jgi:hypothetical protein